MNLRSILVRKPWVSRALALSLLLVSLAVGASLVTELVHEQHRKYDEAIENRGNLLAGYRRVASNRPQIESAMARVDKLDTARYFLKTSSPSLAAAELQESAQAIFAANGMKQSSVNIAPHKDEEGRRKIGVVFNLHGTPEAAQKMLYALETHLPYLFIDNLSIKSTVNSRRWQPTPSVEPEVNVRFDLYGFAQIGKKK